MAPYLSFAGVIPTGISTDQIKHVSEKFAGLFSLNTSNSPFALGEDLEVELTVIYQNLKLNNINNIAAISSKSIIEPMASIRKGLYWNFDVSFTFILPVKSQFSSGYAFNLNHSSKLGLFYIKPELFISNYNLNDILNLNSSGLSIVTFKKINFFYLGLGLRSEFIKGTYEKKILNSKTNKTNFISTSVVTKLFFKSTNLRLTLTYSFLNTYKSESGLSLSFRL